MTVAQALLGAEGENRPTSQSLSAAAATRKFLESQQQHIEPSDTAPQFDAATALVEALRAKSATPKASPKMVPMVAVDDAELAENDSEIARVASIKIQSQWRGWIGRRRGSLFKRLRDDEEAEEEDRHLNRVVVLTEELVWGDAEDAEDRAEQDDIEVVEVAYRLQVQRHIMRDLGLFHARASLMMVEAKAREAIRQTHYKAGLELSAWATVSFESVIRANLFQHEQRFRQMFAACSFKMWEVVKRGEVMQAEYDAREVIHFLEEGVPGIESRVAKAREQVALQQEEEWAPMPLMIMLSEERSLRAEYERTWETGIQMLLLEANEFKLRMRVQIREFCARAAVEREVGEVTFEWECEAELQELMESERIRRQMIASDESLALKEQFIPKASAMGLQVYGAILYKNELLAREAIATEWAQDIPTMMAWYRVQTEEASVRDQLTRDWCFQVAELPLQALSAAQDQCRSQIHCRRDMEVLEWGHTQAMLALDGTQGVNFQHITSQAASELPLACRQEVLGGEERGRNELERQQAQLFRGIQIHSEGGESTLVVEVEESSARTSLEREAFRKSQRIAYLRVGMEEEVGRRRISEDEASTVGLLEGALWLKAADLIHQGASAAIIEEQNVARTELQATIANSFAKFLASHTQKRVQEIEAQEELLRGNIRSDARREWGKLDSESRQVLPVRNQAINPVSMDDIPGVTAPNGFGFDSRDFPLVSPCGTLMGTLTQPPSEWNFEEEGDLSFNKTLESVAHLGGTLRSVATPVEQSKLPGPLPATHHTDTDATPSTPTTATTTKKKKKKKKQLNGSAGAEEPQGDEWDMLADVTKTVAKLKRAGRKKRDKTDLNPPSDTTTTPSMPTPSKPSNPTGVQTSPRQQRVPVALKAPPPPVMAMGESPTTTPIVQPPGDLPSNPEGLCGADFRRRGIVGGGVDPTTPLNPTSTTTTTSSGNLNGSQELLGLVDLDGPLAKKQTWSLSQAGSNPLTSPSPDMPLAKPWGKSPEPASSFDRSPWGWSDVDLDPEKEKELLGQSGLSGSGNSIPSYTEDSMVDPREWIVHNGCPKKPEMEPKRKHRSPVVPNEYKNYKDLETNLQARAEEVAKFKIKEREFFKQQNPNANQGQGIGPGEKPSSLPPIRWRDRWSNTQPKKSLVPLMKGDAQFIEPEMPSAEGLMHCTY